MAKQNFISSLKHVLVHEGGWSDHPRDPGGATMKGITIATFRRATRNRKATKKQLRNISDKLLGDIYKKLYWDKVKGDDLRSGVDYSAFDLGVNAGPRRSIKILQRAAHVVADGAIGPITRAALAKVPAKTIIVRFADKRLAFYRSLRTFRTFGRGWTRRNKECKAVSLKMAS